MTRPDTPAEARRGRPNAWAASLNDAVAAAIDEVGDPPRVASRA